MDLPKDKSIYIYWHIYLTKEGWDIMDDQSNLLVSSGLYDACKLMTIGIIADKDKFEKAKQFLLNKFQKTNVNGTGDIKVRFLHSEENVAEYLVLKKIYEDCVDPAIWFEGKDGEVPEHLGIKEDDYVLYFHTKGASVSQIKYPINFMHKFMWRKAMEFFVIERWQKCINVMEEDSSIDVCGSFLRSSDRQEYSDDEKNDYDKQHKPVFYKKHIIKKVRPTTRFLGNFWWTKCRHVQNISVKHYRKLKFNQDPTISRKGINHGVFIAQAHSPYCACCCCAFPHFNKVSSKHGRANRYINYIFNHLFFNLQPKE